MEYSLNSISSAFNDDLNFERNFSLSLKLFISCYINHLVRYTNYSSCSSLGH